MQNVQYILGASGHELRPGQVEQDLDLPNGTSATLVSSAPELPINEDFVLRYIVSGSLHLQLFHNRSATTNQEYRPNNYCRPTYFGLYKWEYKLGLRIIDS